MATDLTAFADATDSFRRRTRELAASEVLPDGGSMPGAPPDRDRLRAARQLRQGSRRLIRMGDDVAADWLAFLLERRYSTRDEELATVNHFIATCDDALELIAQGRALWSDHAAAGGQTELAAELDAAGRRLAGVRDQAGDHHQRASRPWHPRDPERYAEAMRRVDEPGVPAEVLLAQLRRRADAQRAAG